MRSDRDNRSSNEHDIDDFLAQFDTPSGENSYVNDYLEESSNDSFIWDDMPTSTSRQETSSHGELRTPYNPSSYNSSNDYNSFEGNGFELQSNKIDDFINDENSHEIEINYSSNKRQPSNKKESKLSSYFSKKKSEIKDKTSNFQKPKNFSELIDFLFMKDGKVSFKKIIRDCIAFFAAIFICCILYALVIIITAPGIKPHDIYATIDTSSTIYDDEGQAVDSVFYTENRKIISYNDMPEDLINSFVAIEDKTFWKHHGFNWTRMIGAVISSITGHGRISGTSTITQQLSRNVYLADTKSVRSIRRKILEMYYAARIEAALSKEEIIEAYLNTIYLGYGCYGVDSASKAYFSKSVSDLTTIECASLAALPQAPESYALVQYATSDNVLKTTTTVLAKEHEDDDTFVANDTSKERRDLVLSLMNSQGYLSDTEYNKLKGTDLTSFLKPTFRVSGAGAYSYYHEYLVDTVIDDLMEKYGLSYADAEKMVYTQGLKIYSTMDSTAQKVATKEIKNSSNYPSIEGMHNRDSDGNIVKDGQIILFKYSNFFDEEGNFTLDESQAKINSDGSVTIKDKKRLNVYKTEISEGVDYSLEFKYTYTEKDGILYSYPGGYINIPYNYKSINSNGNLVISADFFKDNPDLWVIDKENKTVKITSKGYSLAQKTIQPQAAMVIVGVGTGEVKAMVGGRTTKGQKLYNRALNPRQSGSSIKPLAVYGAALQKSFELQQKGETWKFTDFGIDKQGTKGFGSYMTTYSTVVDEKTHMEGRDWPKNSGGGFSGKQTFMTAIQKSLNTCAVKIQLQVGADFSAEMLKRFGLTTIVTDETQAANDMNPAALALGGFVKGVIPLEMALAYASFPAGGKLNTPICYYKVEDRNGEVILESESTQSEVMDEGVAWVMTEVLKSVVTNGIAGGAAVPNVQSGGKTGTTDLKYDLWFDGFTPTYAAALWIGTDNNIKMSGNSAYTARLWSKILKQVPKALTGTYKAQPANVIRVKGCWFTKGTEVGLETYTPEDDLKLIKKVEDYYYGIGNISIEEACIAVGVTFEDYQLAGGKIKAGSISPVVPEETPEEPIKPSEGEEEEEGNEGTGGTT